MTIKNLQSKGDLSGPIEALPFVGEPFYPHLATLLAHEEVPKSLRRRLTRYREQRDQAAANIGNHINKTASLSPEDAETCWLEFNQANMKAWEKLERERDWLWSRLQHGGTWAPGVKINDILQLANIVRGGGSSIDLTQLRILQYFGPGLSAEQRDIRGQIGN